ncbi:CYTH domain-containing protein [Nonlabens ulvanivorans]|uniref:CYTH domain-containing protein n=1 Tax=Nonlabens ulvanivorans TaxID=906888 RepID=UPI002941F69B|nr:CYTH domain-containing protein [Nonlabens ulvanivorans]WOI22587.1 CYTH domain-containing protein [Nonlabens ulvanivorans]
MLEIERKYLVKHTDFLKELKGIRITQGYLSIDPARTVRVRIKGTQGFITIKGQSTDSGLTRYEWEKEISIVEAEELLELALPGVIDKTRFEVAIEKHIWEIDVFHASNKGLVVAEIELETEETQFALPEWIAQEVTGDQRYYNSYLSEKPFSEW